MSKDLDSAQNLLPPLEASGRYAREAMTTEPDATDAIEPDATDAIEPDATDAGKPARARLAPVTGLERLESVDTLRGVAVLGILVMNVYAYAMPFAAYANPLVYGGSTGVHYLTWVVTHLVFDQKFLTLFSMLFGAGLVLMGQRAEARGAAFAGIYYRRQLWLLVLGAVHGYLLWFGDILFHYALCGLFLYPLRRLSPRTLIAIGVLFLLVAPPLSIGMGSFLAQMRDAAAAAEAAAAAGETLDETQQATIESWAGMDKLLEPPPEEIARQVEVHRGGYLGILVERAPTVFMMHTFMTFTFIVWRVGGLMILGMALMKLGVFSAARPARFYRACVALGYGLGLPLSAWSAAELTAHGFDAFYVFEVGIHYNYFGSVAVAFGHLGVVMLLCRSGLWPRLRARLAATGRMALTNYLMQTILLTTVFYGYGLGLYGHVPRFYQMAFVAAVLALELWWSPVWLARFRFGPFEWLWRSLTYWRRQPLRRPQAGESATA